MPAWQPILTPLPVIISFVVIGVIFIPLGYALFVASENVFEVMSDSYENCGDTCNITFTNLNIQNDKIYIYYRLENFYQNHRRYVKSRNDAQLRGQKVTRSEMADCAPFIAAGDKDDDLYYPCGLIARSLFNDSFIFTDGNGTLLPVTTDGVAWPSDIDTKFNNPEASIPGVRVIPNFKDVDFVVWMRTAALPTFRKLYRIMKGPYKGDLVVHIKNNFPVTSFEGKKYIVVATTSWLGGKNPFLGYAYMVVGAVCLFLAIVFGLKHAFCGRAQGDPSYLGWNK
uniref:Cell cycle control protein n=1 Tax=Arcella intermedia TaxID=1963864 RepID=A0A6B2LCR9_9EUKA